MDRARMDESIVGNREGEEAEEERGEEMLALLQAVGRWD